MQRLFSYSLITLLLSAACITLFSCTQGDMQDISASMAAASGKSPSASTSSQASSLTISPGASAAVSSEKQMAVLPSQAASVSSASSSKAASSKVMSSKAVSSERQTESFQSSSGSKSVSSSKAAGTAQDYGPRLSDDASKVTNSSFNSGVADEILSQLNELRANQGLNPLTKSSSLTKGAKIRAKEMFDYEHFAHTRPDGSSWETVFHIDVPLSGCKYIGENLAEYENIYPDATSIMNLWVESPTHYENMVRAEFTHVGIAVYYGELTDGGQLVYAVQEFATFS